MPPMPQQSVDDFMRSRAPQPPGVGAGAGAGAVAGAGIASPPSVDDFMKSRQPQPPPGPDTSGYSLSGFGGNVVSSAGSLLGNVATTLAHPLNTIESITQLGLGAGAKLTGPDSYFGRELESRREQIGQGGTNPVDDLMTALKQRYGGVENIKKTAYQDPVGMLADMTALLGGAGAAVRGVGEVSGLTRLAEAGRMMGTAATAADPLNLMTKAATPVARAAGNVAAAGLGISTGAGRTPITRAFLKPTPEFYQAMRGQKTIEDIVQDAKDAVGQLRTKASADYRSKLQTLPVTNVNVAPLAKDLEDGLNNFGVTLRRHPRRGGGFTVVPDFAPQTSPLVTVGDKASQTEMRGVVNQILNTPLEKGGSTTMRDAIAAGRPSRVMMDSDVLDALHKRLGDLYSENSNVKAFTARVNGSARGLLSQIPGYDEMTSTYRDAVQFIKQADQELSTKAGANPGTVARKLNNALNQNNEYRQNLLSKLDTKAATKITDAIAGHALNQIEPRGLMRMAAGGDIALLIGHALSGTVPFSMGQILALPATSPRTVGEVLGAAGTVAQSRGARAVGRAVTQPMVYRPAMAALNPESLVPTPPPQ